jgi:ABC-2 type transport system ATP-binding protein
MGTPSADSLHVSLPEDGRYLAGEAADECTRQTLGVRDPVLRVANLRKRYGAGGYALDGVTVSFESGLTGLLGPNGAGKSTLMRCIAGVENWEEGSIELSSPQPGGPGRGGFGYMPETVAFPGELRVRSYLQMVCSAKGVGKGWGAEIAEKARATGLSHVLDRVVGNLSRGYRQRLGLAQAMIADPPVLILDEPVSSLDPINLIDVRRAIRAYAASACVIVSTHQLAEATALCDRVVLLARGQVAFDGPLSALGRHALRSFEIEVLVGDAEALRSRVSHIQGIRSIRVTRENMASAVTIDVPDDQALAGRIAMVVSAGCDIIGVRPVRDALEEAFASAVASAAPGRHS